MIYRFYIFSPKGELLFFNDWRSSISATNVAKSGSFHISASRTTSFIDESAVPVSHSMAHMTLLDRSSPTMVASAGTGPVADENISSKELFDNAKLLFGAIQALKNIVQKLSKNPANDSFVSFKTSLYKVHYLASGSGLGFVLITDPLSDNTQPILRHIFSAIYVEFVTKNPLTAGMTRDERWKSLEGNTAFRNALNAYIKSINTY